MVQQIEVLKGVLGAAPAGALLSQNQERVLALLDRVDEISTKTVSEKLKIPTVTAKQILIRLLELKLVRRQGAGRATRYIKI
jgi:predicted ArsR family transcriptional regulator